MLNESNKNFTILEIGASSAKLIAGSFLGNAPYVFYVKEVDSRGAMDRSAIINHERLRSIIGQLIDVGDESLTTKISLKNILLIVPPNGVKVFQRGDRSGVLGRTNSEGRIDKDDIESLLRTIATNAETPGLEIIDIIPDYYTIDEGRTFKDPPYWEVSTSLKISAKVHSVPQEMVRLYRSSVENSGLSIMGMDVAPYCASRLIALDQKGPESYLLVDLGGGNTTVSLIGNHTFYASISIPKGSIDLTRRIADSFQISYEKAERLKIVHGYDRRVTSFQTPIVSVPVEGEKPHTYFQSDLNHVIEEFFLDFNANLEAAINRLLENEMRNNNQEGRDAIASLPALLIGGGASLYGIEDLLAKGLTAHKPARFIPNIIGARDAKYTNLLGLLVAKCTAKGPLSLGNGNRTLSRREK